MFNLLFQDPGQEYPVWQSIRYRSEKTWHDAQQITKQDDGAVIFEAEVAGTDEIKYWVLNWGAKAVVLSPDSLRGEIYAEAQAMAANYA